MRCGAKSFIVQVDHNNKLENIEINARTPAEARKFIRRKHGDKPLIISVRQK